MKILVIGALGQLGNEIRQMSSSSSHNFVFADVRGDGDEVHPLDIADEYSVMDFVSSDIDVIINCAAYNDVDGAETDEDTAFRINSRAAGILAEAALKTDALLIHFSTDYVFDGRANVPYSETDEPSPIGVYGRSKLAGENAIRQSGCRYMIFRTSWLYSQTGRNFFKTIADKCAESGSIKVVVDQTGTPTCAYDLAFLIMHIIENGMTDKTGLYHYSDEGTATWYDFAYAINSSLGYTCRVEPCRSSEFPRKAGRPSYSVLDKKKVKETFGIEIPHWRESLEMFIMQYE